MSTAYELAIIDDPTLTLADKARMFPYSALLVIIAIACIGFGVLFAAAQGSWDPWASRQATRFGVGVALACLIAMIDIRLWLRYAYVIFAVSIVALVAVELIGQVGKGAQRWLDLGFIQIQPSEVAKITLVLALARYFHMKPNEEIGSIIGLAPALAMIAVPAAFILKQPDLGTALMLAAVGGTLLFLAGVRLWKFGLAAAAIGAAAPVVWASLRDYQQQRVLTFLDPERDPLGAGYHIIQSKIALGSGGVWGKGFMAGTQSNLNFLPEKQTDFAFTMLAEEFGLMGCLALLALYALVIGFGFFVAVTARSQFGRLLALGVTMNFFLYVFVNIAMVIGLIPVVGVPLPLVSFGGSALLTIMVGFGLLFCVAVHREVRIGQNIPSAH
ncbi:MAG: rod shape-determining protein RodA, partial [Pseudomonadota bacterium]